VVRAGKGSGLLLGVRPEDVQLTDGGGVSLRVLSVEYLGADSLVLGTVGSEPVAVRAAGRVELAPGARASIAWSPRTVHVFDETTGRRCDEGPTTLLTAHEAAIP